MADESKYPTRIAPYGLRMPPDLKDRVQAAAEANNRSMNAEIVATLEEKYPAPERWFDFRKWDAHQAKVEARSQEILHGMQNVIEAIGIEKSEQERSALMAKFNILFNEHKELWDYSIEDDQFYTSWDEVDIAEAPSDLPRPETARARGLPVKGR